MQNRLQEKPQTEADRKDRPEKQIPQQEPEHPVILSSRDKTDTAKVLGFVGVLAVIGLIGLLIFLRPAVSETEGRELTPFPAFSWDAFVSGSYFSGITAWYADTFPGRDGLIAAQHALEKLYGIRTSQIILPGTDPTGPTDPGSIRDEVIEQPTEGIYVKGDSAFEIFTYQESKASRYAALLNRARAEMPGVELYDLVVPLSYAVNMTAGEQRSIGASDAADAIAKIYAKMDPSIRTVNILPELLAHSDEYLYFRTDHHWTARGAYHAYRVFCESAGITPQELTAMESMTFTGFRGSFWAKATGADLREDVVEAWIPNATNKMTVWDWENYGKQDQKEIVTTAYPIIQTRTGNGSENGYYYGPRWKYNCFIAGDNALSVIENPDLHDGSSILVVKESFGNAFAPFLVDKFQTVYVVDYRFFRERMGQSLPDFVREKGVQKVLFLNNFSALSSDWLYSKMESLF